MSADAPFDHRDFEIFLSAPPGLEDMLLAEAQEAGFPAPAALPGGVAFRGNWADVARANLTLRGAGRVLARIGGFRAAHLAQLDKRARKFPWGEFLRPDTPVKVEASCKASRIYHDRAAAQRVGDAIRDTLGAPKAQEGETRFIRLLARIEDDYVAFSVDCSGEPLHRRGLKLSVAKAPMRETLAALMLRRCGYDGAEPVLDPMCGSGTFILEAAEIALGLPPGRARRFSLDDMAIMDPEAWAAMKAAAMPALPEPPERARLIGSDRNEGAVQAARDNAARAGIEAFVRFSKKTAARIEPPEGPPGLVIVNPPYGGRIGSKDELYGLYAGLGKVLAERFAGWRVGLATSEDGLAKATGLPWEAQGPVIPHGGLKVRLHRTKPLG